MRVQFFFLGIAIALAACGPIAPARDKAFFTANPKERAKAIALCRNDPARDGRDPACISAIQAEAEAEHLRVFHGASTRPPGAANASNI